MLIIRMQTKKSEIRLLLELFFEAILYACFGI